MKVKSESAVVDHNRLWEILKEMGIPDHLTCLLRNLYAGQEATVRTGHGHRDGGAGRCDAVPEPWGGAEPCTLRADWPAF